MQRLGKILCGFGLLEVLGAVILLAIFEHLPYPWGVGTLPGGLSTVGHENDIDQTRDVLGHVFAAILGTGLLGVLFLLLGALTIALSVFKPKRKSPLRR